MGPTTPPPGLSDSTADLETYQTLFDSMPCNVSVQDRDFRIIKVNKRFEAEFGHRIGERCFSVYKGRDGICPACSVEKTFQDGQVHHSEETVIKRNGQEATILVTTSPVFDRDNRVVAAIEMSLDITSLRSLQAELRTSEERYRVLFNNQPNPIFVVELPGLLIVDANHTALQDYGCRRADLADRTFLELAPQKERARIEEAIRKRERHIPKVQQIGSDGSVMVTNLRISYPRQDGKDLAIVTISDVTEQLTKEQQLAQASKLATLGEMSAGIAHELNQPLSVIKSGSTFLCFLAKKVIQKTVTESGEDSPVVSIQAEVLRSLTDEIDGQVDRATRIIQHLREFGRKTDLTREEVDLNECVRRAFLLLGRQLENRGIEVRMELEEPLPPILADRARLEQVFINLILNARDALEERFCGPQSVRGEMSILVRSFEEGDRTVVTVRDTGCGIPEENLNKIFDPFFTTKAVGKGTGLGLSISYGIVRDYGGRILVESAPGKGAVFTISFPAHVSQEARSECH